MGSNPARPWDGRNVSSEYTVNESVLCTYICMYMYLMNWSQCQNVLDKMCHRNILTKDRSCWRGCGRRCKRNGSRSSRKVFFFILYFIARFPAASGNKEIGCRAIGAWLAIHKMDPENQQRRGPIQWSRLKNICLESDEAHSMKKLEKTYIFLETDVAHSMNQFEKKIFGVRRGPFNEAVWKKNFESDEAGSIPCMTIWSAWPSHLYKPM